MKTLKNEGTILKNQRKTTQHIEKEERNHDEPYIVLNNETHENSMGNNEK